MTPTGSCPRIRPGFTGILAANDVDVRAANRRRRDPDHRFAGAAAIGLGTSSTAMPILAFEYDSFHGFHRDCFLRPHSRAVNRLHRYST